MELSGVMQNSREFLSLSMYFMYDVDGCTEKQFVFQPRALMERVVAITHYLPDHWKNNTHTYQV